MFDWKIIATGLVVLCILAIFVGSSPGVSSFLGEVGDRLGAAGSKLGIDFSEKGNNNFSLILGSYDPIAFRASLSDISLRGNSSADIDKGTIKFQQGIFKNFTGSGTIDGGLQMNGSADLLQFDGSTLSAVRISMLSQPESLQASRISIQDIAQDNVKGQLMLDGSITQFSGKLTVHAIQGTMFVQNGSLEIDGTAARIEVPSAGIKIGY